MTNTETKEQEPLTFEAAIAKLEAIVKQLEDEKLELKESTKLFEQGSELAKYCTVLLDNNERYLAKLLEQNGELEEQEISLLEE